MRLFSWERTPLYFLLREHSSEALDLVLFNSTVQGDSSFAISWNFKQRDKSGTPFFFKNIHQSLLPGFSLAPKGCSMFSSTADASLIPLNEKFT